MPTTPACGDRPRVAPSHFPPLWLPGGLSPWKGRGCAGTCPPAPPTPWGRPARHTETLILRRAGVPWAGRSLGLRGEGRPPLPPWRPRRGQKSFHPEGSPQTSAIFLPHVRLPERPPAPPGGRAAHGKEVSPPPAGSRRHPAPSRSTKPFLSPAGNTDGA